VQINIDLSDQQTADVIEAFTGKHGIEGTPDAEKLGKWAWQQFAANCAQFLGEQRMALGGWYDPEYADAAAKSAAATAAAAEVQAYIDADAKLSAAGFVASADAISPNVVVVTFPTDLSTPAFYAAAASEIVQTHGGTYITAPYVVRQSKGKWAGHLSRITSVL
jgi:uncharacterized protein (DUF1330 family)